MAESQEKFFGEPFKAEVRGLRILAA